MIVTTKEGLPMWNELRTYLRPRLQDSWIWELRRALHAHQDLKSWRGKQSDPLYSPPHVVKERIVEAYAGAFGVTTLVETGTYLGDMVWAMRRRFQRLISIELSERLSDLARHRFRKWPQVQILTGDSGAIMPNILAEIQVPCLFWLDGHWSGGMTARTHIDTPIQLELEAILNHSLGGHIILIDDARCFDGTAGYPTIDEVHRLIAARLPDYAFSVSNDVIRVHPKHHFNFQI